MEASTLTHASRYRLLARRSALLRLQGDERLVALIRGRHDRAFEVLFDRYQPRLLAFCRGMLASTEDAEDVLQEVFVNAHAAMIADSRPINVRPWLYRIARNRCLNHLRRQVPEGHDSMDVHPDNGTSTLERVQRREELRAIFADVAELPETQRTALVLREIDDLSYEEIAEAMGTTLAAVKSLLVRARMSLAEASEARVLDCGDVRLQLAEAAEGLRKLDGATRHHVRKCEGCGRYRRELRSTTRALAGLAPMFTLWWLKKLVAAKVFGGSSSGGAATSAGGAGAGAGGAGAGAGGAGAGGIGAGAGAGAAGTAGATAGAGSVAAAGAAGTSGVAIGGGAAAGGLAGGGVAAGGGLATGAIGAVGAKAATGFATAALLTAGAVGVQHYAGQSGSHPAPAARTATAPPRVETFHRAPAPAAKPAKPATHPAPAPQPAAPATPPAPAPVPAPATTPPTTSTAPAPAPAPPPTTTTTTPTDPAATTDPSGTTGTGAVATTGSTNSAPVDATYGTHRRSRRTAPPTPVPVVTPPPAPTPTPVVTPPPSSTPPPSGTGTTSGGSTGSSPTP